MPQTPKSPANSDATGEREIRGKLGLLVALMRRPQGADISDMMEATGWQQHSVRGALAGALKKHRGLNIVSEKADGPRVYRVIAPKADATEALVPVKSDAKASKPKAAKAKTTKAAKAGRVKADA